MTKAGCFASASSEVERFDRQLLKVVIETTSAYLSNLPTPGNEVRYSKLLYNGLLKHARLWAGKTTDTDQNDQRGRDGYSRAGAAAKKYDGRRSAIALIVLAYDD